MVDKAYKMSAAFWGNERKETKRDQLGKRLGRNARHLLLMTAQDHAQASPRLTEIRDGNCMSARETPITRAYWRSVGGTLVEEFPVVTRTTRQSPRLLDAIILPDGPHEIAHWRDVSVEGKHVICVQTKDSRLGMYLRRA